MFGIIFVVLFVWCQCSDSLFVTRLRRYNNHKGRSDSSFGFNPPLAGLHPIFRELADTRAMKRLGFIDMYGMRGSGISRLSHSWDVLCVLHDHGASLLDQIAGFLHDASHTMFSHAADRVFRSRSYHDDVQLWYLMNSDIPPVLKRYGIMNVSSILKNNFKSLHNRRQPTADNIAYGLWGAVWDLEYGIDYIEKVYRSLRYSAKNGFYFEQSSAMAELFARMMYLLSTEVWFSEDSLLTDALTATVLDLLIPDKDKLFSYNDCDIVDLIANTEDEDVFLMMSELSKHLKNITENNSPAITARRGEWYTFAINPPCEPRHVHIKRLKSDKSLSKPKMVRVAVPDYSLDPLISLGRGKMAFLSEIINPESLKHPESKEISVSSRLAKNKRFMGFLLRSGNSVGLSNIAMFMLIVMSALIMSFVMTSLDERSVMESK